MLYNKNGRTYVTDDTPENERCCKCCNHRYLTEAEEQEERYKTSQIDITPFIHMVDVEVKKRFDQNTLLDTPEYGTMSMWQEVSTNKIAIVTCDPSTIYEDASVGHSGDIFVGMVAMEDVEFEIAIGGKQYFTDKHHMKKGQFHYALLNTYMIPITSLGCHRITIHPRDASSKIKLVYATIDRNASIKMIQNPIYIPLSSEGKGKEYHIIKNEMFFKNQLVDENIPSHSIVPSLNYTLDHIAKIQTAWRDAIANPKFNICRKRLLNEYQNMVDRE